MAFEKLTAGEQEIVLRCMHATAAYVDDWEKHARLGLDPKQLQEVISDWPRIDDTDQNGPGFLAVNNCLNEVCHGFRIGIDEWENWFNTPLSTVESVYQKWLLLQEIPGGIR